MTLTNVDKTLVHVIDKFNDSSSECNEKKGCLLGRIFINIGKRAACLLLGIAAVIITIISIPFFAIALAIAAIRDYKHKPYAHLDDLNARTWVCQVGLASLYAPMSSIKFFVIFFKGPEKNKTQ